MDMALKTLAWTLCLSAVLISPVLAQPDGSLAGLHDALRLRPEQEQSWQIFQRASTSDPNDQARHRDAFERMGQLRAPDRMNLSIQMMQADLAEMRRRTDALSTFYAMLSPEQQNIFDRQTAPPAR
jgi:protein CpxP